MKTFQDRTNLLEVWGFFNGCVMSLWFYLDVGLDSKGISLHLESGSFRAYVFCLKILKFVEIYFEHRSFVSQIEMILEAQFISEIISVFKKIYFCGSGYICNDIPNYNCISEVFKLCTR